MSAVVAHCVLVLALVSGSLTQSGGLFQSLPYLEFTGQGESGAVNACDDCSGEVAIKSPFPFGDYCHDTCYVGVNGIISFGTEINYHIPELFPTTNVEIHYAYVLAPFWADADIRRRGSISWEVHTVGDSSEGDDLLNEVSVFIENRENVSFVGNWMLLVNYDQVPHYHPFTLFFDVDLPNNSYQAVVITDGTKSYVVYTYKCGLMEWSGGAVIGYNAVGTYFENHNISGSRTHDVACLALPEEVNNLVYDLVPNPSGVQCSLTTPEPPNTFGSCTAAGYDTCCEGGTCSGQPDDCFCDKTCRFYGDCCRDIDLICPQGNFTDDGNETYLLFANAFHINRVSIDGENFEILHTNFSSGAMVALDYHYSQGYMYWSDTRSGTLNRAHLNGSSPEVVLQIADAVIDDIAVDWVNNKLYFTEAVLSEVLVLDIEQRKKTTLIVNRNGTSTTRAIAVDPTTGYMYYSDWGSESRIERAGMDGNYRTILHNTNLVWPNGITLDYMKQTLYWVDASLNTIERSNVDGSGRILLQRINDDLFHPFALTLEKEFLFWTDWSRVGVFSTHKDLPYDNIVSIYNVLVNAPHGIEAVSPERQMDAKNPCDTASCIGLCLLSPDSDGYSCVCADKDNDCESPIPTPLPTSPPVELGSCVSAGYSGCCRIGACRGRDVSTGELASCTCDEFCREMGTCCYDVAESCPSVHHTCSAAGHTSCCPAGTGCTNPLVHCSCDADCFENNTCCVDAQYFCQMVTVGLTSSNYTGSEGSGFITAQVSFSRNLANPIVLTFHPVTYSVYQSTVGPLPDGFVIPAKGFEASDKDFIGNNITVTLPRFNGSIIRQVDIQVPIVDDEINEHPEKFLAYMTIYSAMDESIIQLERTVTQLTIADDDDIAIGFDRPTYTFIEGEPNVNVVIRKDSGVSSERTDIDVRIELTGTSSATPGIDFQISLLNTTIHFDPATPNTLETMQVSIPLNIIDDFIFEKQESFNLTISKSADLQFGPFHDTFATTEVFIIDNTIITEVPGPVIGLQVASLSSSGLIINWSPPEFGGPVQFYQVSVSTISENIRTEQTSQLFLEVNNLNPEVPYYVRVEPVNSIGSGTAQLIIAFTKEGIPNVSPEVSVSWKGLFEMLVEWKPLTLEEARGFITSYIVTYSSADSRRRKRATGTVEVPGDQNSVSIDDLDPDIEYSVSVAAATTAGTGVGSDPIIPPSAGVLFQLRFVEVSSCEKWQDQESAITSQIAEKLETVVSGCVSCNLQASSVTDRVIQCSGDSSTATFRALLLGDMNENQAIIDFIKEWVELGGSITIDDLPVKLDSNCDVLIESLQDEHCTETTEPPSSATTEPSSTDKKSSGINAAAIVVPILLVVILIAIIVLIVVLYLYKKRNEKEQQSYMNFDEPDNSGTARLSMNLYDPSADRRNYNNPLYGEISDEKQLPED